MFIDKIRNKKITKIKNLIILDNLSFITSPPFGSANRRFSPLLYPIILHYLTFVNTKYRGEFNLCGIVLLFRFYPYPRFLVPSAVG